MKLREIAMGHAATEALAVSADEMRGTLSPDEAAIQPARGFVASPFTPKWTERQELQLYAALARSKTLRGELHRLQPGTLDHVAKDVERDRARETAMTNYRRLRDAQCAVPIDLQVLMRAEGLVP